MRKRITKPTGRPTGAPRRHRGRLGLWVLLHFRLTLAGRALRIHALFPELILQSELILGNPAVSQADADGAQRDGAQSK